MGREVTPFMPARQSARDTGQQRQAASCCASRRSCGFFPLSLAVLILLRLLFPLCCQTGEDGEGREGGVAAALISCLARQDPHLGSGQSTAGWIDRSLCSCVPLVPGSTMWLGVTQSFPARSLYPSLAWRWRGLFALSFVLAPSLDPLCD
jgi:hypothetical protein